jgi:hypothetical protein
LYRECLVADIDTFAQNIKTNPRKLELLNQTRALRLYQPVRNVLTDPTYAQLVIEKKWHFCGAKEYAYDHWAGADAAAEDEDFAKRYLYKSAYRELQSATYPSKDDPHAQSVFVNLTRVIMTGVPDTFPWGLTQDDFTHFHKVLELAQVPLFFLDLPTVKHFCQTRPTGPFALPGDTIEILHPPDIVTIHPHSMLQANGPSWLSPIVLGCTNRLMFRNAVLVGSLTDRGEELLEEDVAPLFDVIYTMLARPVLLITNCDDQDPPARPPWLGNTKVELYNYIRQVNETNLTGNPNLDRYLPSDLTHIQSLFDEQLGRWKGVVIFKNWEECPPCSACGFEGHWND